MAISAEAEVEKMKKLEERIKAPSIWGRVPCGIRFEDLQDRRYEDAIRLLKQHYLPEEIRYLGEGTYIMTCEEALRNFNDYKDVFKYLTYKSVKISEDKEGVDEFTHNVRIWMKDKMSIAAIKEGTDKLVGVLIMRIQEKSAFSRTFSRVKITYNPQYTTVMTFNKEIEKEVNLYDKLEVRRYFKVYLLALKPRYRHRGIAKEMLKAAIALSASANVPAIACVFTTSRGQQIAEELGFEKYKELYYVRYIIDDEIVFWDTGLGNYGAALMAYRIPAVEEPQELQIQASSRFILQPAEEEDD